jgi:phage tail sheath gpL-like
MAKRADNDPAFDYAGLQLTGILPGTDGEQWTFAQRDQALKAGSSTVEVEDGVVELSDTVTFYHPTGELDPAYRYVVDIVKLQNVIYNFDQEFAKDEWNGAPFIPDDQATTNRNARKPKSVKTAAFSVLDRLGLAAILADVETSKKLVTVVPSTTNPKRWDLDVPLFLSGNSNVRSVTLRWGFYYG